MKVWTHFMTQSEDYESLDTLWPQVADIHRKRESRVVENLLGFQQNVASLVDLGHDSFDS
jgi:hypothetical protein